MNHTETPLVLDLFCCEGVGARGYIAAGFRTIGADIEQRFAKRYSGQFVHAPWEEALEEYAAEADLIHLSPPCFVAGTPVLTRDGTKPIEDVQVGDEVWTHQNRWRTVTNTMSREAETITIGYVTCTLDHPYYVREPGRVRDSETRRHRHALGEPKWVNAVDTKGTFLATPNAVDCGEVVWMCDPWLVGRYVADGWNGRDGVMLAVTGEHDQGVAAWLRSEFGHDASSRRIPTWLLSAPPADRQRFLDGYISGGGYRVNASTVAGTTTSALLASGLKLLAVSLGFTVSIRTTTPPPLTVAEGRTVSQRPWYGVVISRNDGRYTVDDGGMRWHKQRRTPVPAGWQTVYDITVDEDHSFTAWGDIVHNCQGYTIATAGNPEARAKYPRLIPAVREAAKATGKPFVIENVAQARSEMQDPVLLCGTMFGLTAIDDDGTPLEMHRHRLFEAHGFELSAPGPCQHGAYSPQVAGSYGGARRDKVEARTIRKGGYVPSKQVQEMLLGVPHDAHTLHGLWQSIPPAYTEHIGRQFLTSL